MATKESNKLKIGNFYKFTDKENGDEQCGFYIGDDADKSWVVRKIDEIIVKVNPISNKYASYGAALESAVRAAKKKNEVDYNESQTNTNLLSHWDVTSYIEKVGKGIDFAIPSPEDVTVREVEDPEKPFDQKFFDEACDCLSLTEFGLLTRKHNVNIVHKRQGEVEFTDFHDSKEVPGTWAIRWKNPDGSKGGCRLEFLPNHFIVTPVEEKKAEVSAG